MSFTRRFSSFPTAQTISQIEGVVIVDLPAPASIQGVSTGVVGVVGEFADMRYAVSVNANGDVTTNLQPQEVSSTADMKNKFGGWDSTLGDFGGDDGNGYFTVYGNRFSRLVLCPINLASSKAVRVWRTLPLNTSVTNPTPAALIQSVSIPAGTVFQTANAVDVVRLATAVTFSSLAAYAEGTDGTQETSSGASLTFSSASSDFNAIGVKTGDILVLGVDGGDGAPGTYRIKSISNTTTLLVETLDGTSGTFAPVNNLPWRIHVSTVADTGGEATFAAPEGYTIPVRPTKVDGASNVDGTIDAGTLLIQPVPTTTGALANLTMVVGPDGLAYTAAVQAPNAVTGPGIESLYQAGLSAMLSDSDPIREVSVIVTSRTSANIRAFTKEHVLQSSAQGRGRMACIAPPLTELDTTTVLSSAYVGANRDERVIFCWPAVKQFFQDAVDSGDRIKLATGQYSTDGVLDKRADIFMASILSNLASERNPGQATDPIPLCLAPVLGFQSGISIAQFSMADYIRFRAGGVCAIRFDRAAGKVFQSGITTALAPNQKNINRRRMADEIQDSLASAYSSYVKQPLTSSLKNAINGATVGYLEGLKSTSNPAAQRIEGYSVDPVSGNTPELNGQGIYVVIVRVRMLATADDIVIQSEIGPTVTVTAA